MIIENIIMATLYIILGMGIEEVIREIMGKND